MSKPRRRQFYYVFALMVTGAFAEIATIGAVVPFLSLLSGTETDLPIVEKLFELFGARGRTQVLIAAAAFASLAILSGVIRLQLARSTQDFAYRVSHDLMVDVERRILLQPYTFHIQWNSSTLLAGLEKAELLVFELILPLMQAATAGFLAIFIILALIWVDPVVATAAAVGFTAIYLVVTAVTRRRLERNSAVVGRGFDERLKVAQESLAGIRDIIIDDSHSLYLSEFERVNLGLSAARSRTSFLASAPRFIIETIGMVAIAGIAVAIFYREGSIAGALPIIGAIALGAQRLLPLLQQIYGGWSTSAGNRALLEQTLGLLDLTIPDSGRAAVAPLPFNERIRAENLSFTFPGRSSPAIQNVSLEIKRGLATALVGETGAGKSTFADLLMGLLEPTSGRICVDDQPLSGRNRRRWQRCIAHVPQSIFIADTSIARNISLGAADRHPDMRLVIEASQTAQLHEFVTSLPDGYETIVGERGIRLSGGQRQRLGIARAIYKNALVLVLDEATSALDDATEAAVLDGLLGLREAGRTIIIIAHRASTIARCDLIARLSRGRLVDLSAPDPIVMSVR